MLPLKHLVAFSALALLALHTQAQAQQWQTVTTTGQMTPRHEAGLVSFKDKLYLLGGRRINPVNVLDPVTLKWQQKAPSPIEMHHFQPAVWQDRIVIAGAMTGKFPFEPPTSHLYFYFPATDSWEKGPEIPADRRRGGAGVVVDKDKLYLIAGITNGHYDGHVSWLDVYDFNTRQWQKLPDAPRQRDHFQAAIIAGKIYLAGGRRTSQATKQVFSLLVPEVDVFDIQTQTWSTLHKPLPTLRAGNSTFAHQGHLYVVGGESTRKFPAHNEVEIYDPTADTWTSAPPLQRGRHGTGIGLAQGYMWTASGSGSRGGKPELPTTERMPAMGAESTW